MHLCVYIYIYIFITHVWCYKNIILHFMVHTSFWGANFGKRFLEHIHVQIVKFPINLHFNDYLPLTDRYTGVEHWHTGHTAILPSNTSLRNVMNIHWNYFSVQHTHNVAIFNNHVFRHLVPPSGDLPTLFISLYETLFLWFIVNILSIPLLIPFLYTQDSTIYYYYRPNLTCLFKCAPVTLYTFNLFFRLHLLLHNKMYLY
jgi:hypothetical protein